MLKILEVYDDNQYSYLRDVLEVLDEHLPSAIRLMFPPGKIYQIEGIPFFILDDEDKEKGGES